MITLVVLAAGMGSRYGGLKQLDEMGPGGETILDYSVYDAIQAGFERVVFVIRRSFSVEFEQRAQARYGEKVSLAYAYQEQDDLPASFDCPEGREKPWGTAHAVWAAREEVTTPFAVINADDYYGQEAFHIASRFLRGATAPSTDFGLIAYHLQNTLSDHGGVNRGVIEQVGEKLKKVEEHFEMKLNEEGLVVGHGAAGQSRVFAPSTLVSMNFFLFTPALFGPLEEFLCRFFAKRILEPKAESYIPAVVDELISSGAARCLVVSSPDQWYGVTYPEDKVVVQKALHSLHERGDYPSSLA